MKHFELCNGKTYPFKNLGYALEYAHKHGLRVMRQIGAITLFEDIRNDYESGVVITTGYITEKAVLLIENSQDGTGSDDQNEQLASANQAIRLWIKSFAKW